MPNIGKSETLDVFKGINNVVPADKSLDGYLKELVNLDIDKSNNLTKRKGFTSQDTSNYHSLWSDGLHMFAVKDGDLVEIKADSSSSLLVSSIGDSRVTYDYLDGRYYYTSKFKSGQIKDSVAYPWGITPSNLQLTLGETGGTLAKGSYQVSYTYETSDGRESGSSVATVIEVGENSSILVSDIQVSSNSEVAFVNLYITQTNGDDFYRIGQYANGLLSITISEMIGDRPLETFNLYDAPSGSIVKWAHGRFYIVQDNIVWFSQPYEYDLFNLKDDYWYFDEEVTALCPTPDGLWISSDKIYYVAGKDPTSARLTEKEIAKVVRGSDVKFSGAYIFIENTPLGYKWLVTTDKGIFVLFNDGVILNISEQNISMPKAYDAASGFIQEDGINRYVSLLREKEQSNNTAIGDLVTSTIIRNGITIT